MVKNATDMGGLLDHNADGAGQPGGVPWGTWLLIAATGTLSFIVLVELINILFYDPYDDKVFLFRLSGIKDITKHIK
jgi:hypothetical protein